MTKTVGAEGEFIAQIIDGLVDARATMLRYGLLDQDMNALMTRTGMTVSAAQMLSGLLRARTIVGLSDLDIECRVNGAPTSIDQKYLKLGVSAGKALVHVSEISASDKAIFVSNGVELHPSSAVDYAALAQGTGNVVASWSLSEGGNLRAVDVLLDSFKTARLVKIYDRYFDQSAMDTIVEVLSALPADAKAALKVVVLVGREQGGLSTRQIKAQLVVHLDAANVRVSKSDKPARYDNYLHDRYIQVDDSHTYVLAAGVGCFLGSNGKNRASNVFRHDLFISYVNAEVIAQDDSSAVAFKY